MSIKVWIWLAFAAQFVAVIYSMPSVQPAVGVYKALAWFEFFVFLTLCITGFLAWLRLVEVDDQERGP